jgi:cation diffusion facilitator CzcD-associated flavoprotein CzcO
MGIRLKQSGIHSFTVYEKSERVGGTWFENTYPGAGCDVPSHLYCFSFEPNPEWSRKFSPQAEIQNYFEHCTDKYGLREHIRFGCEIESARYDDEQRVWRLRTAAGEPIEADIVVSGTGQLNRPHVPQIPGLDDFAGTAFHSARWNHDYDFTGKNVAVIGNGASAIQFIPCLAPQAAKLTVFQRTANWVVPRNDKTYSERAKWIFGHVPLVLRLYRAWIYFLLEIRFFGFFKDSWLGRKVQEAATQYMESIITDPELRRVLTPDYPSGCKRILISDDYFQALARPNVDVVTSGVERVTRDAVVTGDGRVHAADAIVFATGFEATSFLAPMRFEGAGGRLLSDVWGKGAEAYLGVAVAGFPNLFLLYGPNTNLGHNSILFMIECQVGYVLQCIRDLLRRERRSLAVRPEAMARYNEELQSALHETAWDAGCTSWYKTESGKVTNNWSGFAVEYWWRTLRPDPDAFETRT